MKRICPRLMNSFSAATPADVRIIQSELRVSFTLSVINSTAAIAIFYEENVIKNRILFSFLFGNMTPKSKMAVRKIERQKDLTVVDERPQRGVTLFMQLITNFLYNPSTAHYTRQISTRSSI